MDRRTRMPGQCSVRETNDRFIYGCSKCVNCSNEVSGTTYVALFKLPDRVMTVLEALQLVFSSAKTLFREITPATSVATSYKFCRTCGEVFGQILQLLLKFLKFTSSISIVSNLTTKKSSSKSNCTVNAAEEYCGGYDISTPNSASSSPVTGNDNIEFSQVETPPDSACNYSFDVKPVINELRRSPRISGKSASESPRLSEYLGLTSTTVLFQQIKSKNPESQLVMNRLRAKYGRKMAALRLRKSAGKETEKPFACSNCNKNYKEKAGLLRHIQDKHPTDQDKSYPKTTPFYRCKICSTQTVSEVALKRHLGTHAGTIHERPFTCNKCNYNYKDKKTLVMHMRRAHPAEAEGFYPRVRRARQLRIFTPEEQEWLKTTEFKCAEFPCENLQFHTYPEWLIHQGEKHQLGSQHLNADINKIKFPPKGANAVQPCPRCGKRLYGKQQVVDHIRIVHLGEAVYPCEMCGKTMSNKFSLEKHVQQLHSSTPFKKYLCTVCGAEFKFQGNLRSHERATHNSLVRKIHECHICNMKFILKHRLKDHMGIYHAKTEDFQFFCDICGKGFKVRNQLRNHRSRHVKGASKGEACEFCGKAYAFKTPLKAHLITVHKLSLEDALKSARMKAASKPRVRILPTGEVITPKELKPRNICAYCGRQYARRDQVFLHLMSAHGTTEETARAMTKFESKRKLVTGPGNVPILLKMASDTSSSSYSKSAKPF